METPVLGNPISPKSLISFRDRADDFIEGALSPVNYLTKKLTSTEPTRKVQARSQTIPTLVYRCYDEESQSLLDSKLGFRASLYGSRPRGVTSALSMDDELFEVFAENVRS